MTSIWTPDPIGSLPQFQGSSGQHTEIFCCCALRDTVQVHKQPNAECLLLSVKQIEEVCIDI